MADPTGRFGFDPEPDPRAVAYLDAKGLVRSWRHTSLWREQHAFGFTLAGIWRLDVIDAAQKLTTQAVERGETYAVFQSQFRERLKTLGFDGPRTVTEFAEGPRKVDLTAPWRMRVIYDTNVRAAYAASEWQAIEDTKADFPALEYQGVSDERTRASHQQWFGTIRLVGDAFWRTHYPPNDWYCRCYVIQISVEDLAAGRAKLTSDADLAATGFDPDPQTWPLWTDKKTGRTARVPPDVGPGFAYNAGMARRANVADLLGRRIAGMDPHLASAAAADLVNLPQFQDLVSAAVQLGQQRAAAGAAERAAQIAAGVTRPAAAAAADRAREAIPFSREAWPVGVVPTSIEGVEPTAGRLVVVNPSTIGHSADIHPTDPADWRRIQRMLDGGDVWRALDGTLKLTAVFRSSAGVDQVWVGSIKPVAGAWRVRTLYPSSPRRLARITANARLLRAGRGPIQD